MPVFELDGGVIRVPHIPANVNVRISDHCLKPEKIEMWLATGTDITNKLLNEVIGADRAEHLDRFEEVQLADVLNVCKESKSMS